MIDTYIANCEQAQEYPWTYYYIKYAVFRTGRYGKYSWDNFDESPYVFTTIHQRQKVSENSYNPFLKAIKDDVFGNHINLDENNLLIETQSSYSIVSNDENETKKTYNINQNGDGIDIENRIEKMKTYLNYK